MILQLLNTSSKLREAATPTKQAQTVAVGNTREPLSPFLPLQLTAKRRLSARSRSYDQHSSDEGVKLACMKKLITQACLTSI